MASRACHGVPVEQVDEHFLVAAARLTAAPHRRELDLTAAQALVLFDAQLGSRHLDLAARALKAEGLTYRTERVPFGRDKRPEIVELTGQTRVPVLVDEHEVIHDSKRIREYVEWRYTMDSDD